MLISHQQFNSLQNKKSLYKCLFIQSQQALKSLEIIPRYQKLEKTYKRLP